MARAIVIGAGTIGSHLLPHLARMAGISELTVVDRDASEPSNLLTQNIGTSDVGKSKAMAQVRRLKQINRSIAAMALHRSVEDLALGWLRGDVILACLDSRRARLVVNQAAWRLGVPWIDAGIDSTAARPHSSLHAGARGPLPGVRVGSA
jgi:molybdopterin/thiamine biosynthesis adenylyltransferase